MATRFIVEGASKETGAEQRLEIEAEDAGQAEQIAGIRGLFVSDVRRLESPTTTTQVDEQRTGWRNSPAHLLLLTKFRRCESVARFSRVGYWAAAWEAALKEKPAKAIRRFIEEAMLAPAWELQERLDYKFKASELKSMLKERGLKVSGRKHDLVLRLIDRDAGSMAEITKDVDVYECTVAGMQLAEAYLAREKAKKKSVEEEVLGSFVKEDYWKAVRIVAQFESTQVFARGIGIDWKNYDGMADVKSLTAIFNTTPTILKAMDEKLLRQLRPAAGMMLLWGTNRAKQWFPNGIETGIHLDADAVCRTLVFYANAGRHLDQMESVDAGECGAQVEWSTAGDDGVCPECEAMNGRFFAAQEARGLIPYAKCICEDGCRCSRSPVVKLPKGVKLSH